MVKKLKKKSKKPKAKASVKKAPTFAEPDHAKDKWALVRANITDDLPLIRGEKKLCTVVRHEKTGKVIDVIEEEVSIDPLLQLAKKWNPLRSARKNEHSSSLA